MLKTPPSITDIHLASNRIQEFIHRTPVLTSRSLSEQTGCSLYFKCENFQKAGSFKIRGGSNAVFSLDESSCQKGVATHSSGNFAQALALAASWRKIPAYIVMPRTAPNVKKQAVAGYGGKITLCEPTLQAREEGLEQVVKQTGAFFLHPYNNYDVIAGQGTAALELLNDVPDIDVLVAPVGGGGLISGSAIAAHGSNPEVKVYGAEPQGADDAYKSLQQGKIIPSVNPNTIADGLLTSLGDKTFPIISEHVEDIILVSDKLIVHAMRLIWERMKIIVEPSSAVTLAAILKNPGNFEGKKVGVILSGGNVELGKVGAYFSIG